METVLDVEEKMKNVTRVRGDKPHKRHGPRRRWGKFHSRKIVEAQLRGEGTVRWDDKNYV